LHLFSHFSIADVNEAGLQFFDGENGSIRKLLEELVRLALIEDDAAIRQSILRQIGLLVNKFLESKDTHTGVELVASLLQRLEEGLAPLDNAIRAIFWIAKALVLRLSNTEKILEQLLGLLPSKNFGSAGARGFGLLLAPDEILSKDNGAVIRLLARQKVFNVCAPRMAKDFRNAETAIKPNYLIALAGILKYVPTEVILQDIDSLLPLLLQSLDLDDSEVRSSTIQTLAAISQDSPTAIEGHIGSLVTRLIRSAATSKVNTPSVRLKALQCLQLFPGKVKESKLLPYKSAVTRGLMPMLDDSRRNVRKEAVECRAAYFTMDEPQSD